MKEQYDLSRDLNNDAMGDDRNYQPNDNLLQLLRDIWVGYGQHQDIGVDALQRMEKLFAECTCTKSNGPSADQHDMECSRYGMDAA